MEDEGVPMLVNRHFLYQKKAVFAHISQEEGVNRNPTKSERGIMNRGYDKESKTSATR